MGSSSITAILHSIAELGEPVRVQGASIGAQALTLVRWIEKESRPLIVLTPSDDHARNLAQDIRTLGRYLIQKEIRTAVLPTWDQSPYSSIAPSLRTRIARLKGLSTLTEVLPQADLYLCTLEASLQSTIPKTVLHQATIQLLPEESIESRESLVRRLLEIGYLQVDPVEDPGTFAVRGEIIDLYPIHLDLPVRIELFDNLVEKIRHFDPKSQRTQTQELKRLSIPPAREVLINSETYDTLRAKIKETADNAGIPRQVRDPILSSIHSGVYPDHADAWAPFAYLESTSLWNYLEDTWPVVWSDELACSQYFDDFIEKQKTLSATAVDSGLILPLVEELFPRKAELENRISKQARLYFDSIELTKTEEIQNEDSTDGEDHRKNLASVRHRVSVRENSDLTLPNKKNLDVFLEKFELWKSQNFSTVILSSSQTQLDRLKFLLQERSIQFWSDIPPEPGKIILTQGRLSGGFRWPTEGIVFVTEDEILGTRHLRKTREQKTSAAKDWAGLQNLSDLSSGDLVVHVEHGIGRYVGITRLSLSGAPSDFLQIEYANKDKLYLPVYRLNLIQKYLGGRDQVLLNKLGGQQFEKAKQKVREEVKKLAFDLVDLYAKRKLQKGLVLNPRSSEYREFEARFPFEETSDQLKAIDSTLSDMESGGVMDRLVCGDVGFGKTEVAMRAAFQVAMNGKQVALLVPTTILAFQHEQSFKTRFDGTPVRIESISRFKSNVEQKEILKDASNGKIDILIGTHRILSRDLQFKDLGLVIVDEEHRFGVEHKEKLKTLKTNTHVLTLTATPIPRTLHMSLSGLREISIMTTPPVDRLPIRTYVSKFDEALIKRAIEFELSRGGQVFFLHNRVQSIYEIASRIQDIVPDAKVAVGHGQMTEKQLEKTMFDFYEKRANVLVCTTIIEAGLDVPSANTIIINRADTLGLAQLYQLRGRVGRGERRAYAYLLVSSSGMLSEDAKKRLEVIQRFVELGSGFNIASHDLEIRGGGNLLGAQQSGHIATVGFDLYMELLEEAIAEIQGRPPEDQEQSRDPEIKVPFASFLDENYIPDVHQRLSFYRRLSTSKDEQELLELEDELRDRYGNPPQETQNLIWIIRTKQLLKAIGIETLTVGKEKLSIYPSRESRLDPARAVALVSRDPQKFQLLPDSKIVIQMPMKDLKELYFGLEKVLKEFT